jgi:hypothetical protein
MESRSRINAVESISEVQNSVSGVPIRHSLPLTFGIPRPSRPPLYRNNGAASSSSTCFLEQRHHHNYGTKKVHHLNSFVINQKHSYQDRNNEGLPTKLCSKQLFADDPKNCGSSFAVLESNNCVLVPSKRGVVNQPKNYHCQSEISFCPSPQNSFYSATLYSEAKQSFSNTEVSECVSVDTKSYESGEVSNSCGFTDSRKTSIYRASTGSDVSDESNTSSLSSALYRPHKANDIRWEAIQAIRARDGMLEMRHFRLLKRLGKGDIGSVYLAELSGTRTSFAMKLMNKTELASRKKHLRAQTEREILQSLDHPFLPTLYTHFETETLSCLVMEFCPGGDLHAIMQRQPGKYFSEHAVRSAIPSFFCLIPTISTRRYDFFCAIIEV